MYDFSLHKSLDQLLKEKGLQIQDKDNAFYIRLMANASAIRSLFFEIYGHRADAQAYLDQLNQTILSGYQNLPERMKEKDQEKEGKTNWFLSPDITGMSLYVDRFCGHLNNMPDKLAYLKHLGVNLLHLMPLFESPASESDGGYAVSDFRKVDSRFGSLEDLERLREKMDENGQYLMLDIVLNHTSRQHPWAVRAKNGEADYQDYYYMFPDRHLPDQFDHYMPEIFPESSPGNFTYVEECGKWVMSVFHYYQWDLNYTNPRVFIEMLDTIYFYANIGVDILRIDAPAFIWKQLGTACQNLYQAHIILRLIKLCVQCSTPGMALLGEAIVAPSAIIKYFGTDAFTARECDLAYNATQMALQWDALATGNTQIMVSGQHDILQKPYGCSWINYTRCHDDIGLAYDDYFVQLAGYNPWDHKNFIKNYYTGYQHGSDASGALFSYNPRNHDSRLSGSLASLCGLEKSIQQNNPEKIQKSLHKILLMQANSIFLGGIPMLFYGDELGYTNDYSFLQDPSKSYDNRWMHRPIIDWDRTQKIGELGSPEEILFNGTRKLISIRKSHPAFGDYKNIGWLAPHNDYIAGFIRDFYERKVYCLFNYKDQDAYLTWFAFKQNGNSPSHLFDYWEEREYTVGLDHEYLILRPYQFLILEAKY